jgi:Tfp pilus assembly protein PilF
MPELSGSDEQTAAFLKTAVEQLAHGAVQFALTAASEACHSAPNDSRAHYVYGQAWLAHDQPARAEQAFAAAIKLAPQFADAWINYGVARYRQGAIEDAKTAMRQVLLFAPDHAVAISNLAAFMRISGQSDAAENLLRRQLTHKADDIGAWLNLVADLLQEERAAEALALLKEGGTSKRRSARRSALAFAEVAGLVAATPVRGGEGGLRRACRIWPNTRRNRTVVVLAPRLAGAGPRSARHRLSIFTFRIHGAHGYAHDLADLGWYIAQHERLMAHWKASLPNRILTIRLSDWVEDFDGTLAKLLVHVDLSHDPNCTRFYESDSRVKTVSRAQVRQPINSHALAAGARMAMSSFH